MANIIRGNGGSGGLQRDPFALARDLLGWDPFFQTDFPARTLTQPASFAPTFNVVERQDGYFITADVPGVREEDIDVTVQDNYLVISGSRNAEERKEGDNFYVYERRYGNFSRAFALPDNADAESVEGHLKEGVLEVKVAKRESAKPRKIPLGQRLKEKLGVEKK
jgi:HSP20 family protein